MKSTTRTFTAVWPLSGFAVRSLATPPVFPRTARKRYRLRFLSPFLPFFTHGAPVCVGFLFDSTTNPFQVGAPPFFPHTLPPSPPYFLHSARTSRRSPPNRAGPLPSFLITCDWTPVPIPSSPTFGLRPAKVPTSSSGLWPRQ